MVQRSPEAEAYRRLYKHPRWALMSQEQRRREPLCRRCGEAGRVKAAAVADHVVPHRGNTALFFDAANLQSLCWSCHSGDKQRQEKRGYRADIGPDGWPTDPAHPANAVR